jgi:hypothetical protein
MMGEVSYNQGTEIGNGLFGYKNSEQIFELTTDGHFRVGFDIEDSNWIKFNASSGELSI